MDKTNTSLNLKSTFKVFNIHKIKQIYVNFILFYLFLI